MCGACGERLEAMTAVKLAVWCKTLEDDSPQKLKQSQDGSNGSSGANLRSVGSPTLPVGPPIQDASDVVGTPTVTGRVTLELEKKDSYTEAPVTPIERHVQVSSAINLRTQNTNDQGGSESIPLSDPLNGNTPQDKPISTTRSPNSEDGLDTHFKGTENNLSFSDLGSERVSKVEPPPLFPSTDPTTVSAQPRPSSSTSRFTEASICPTSTDQNTIQSSTSSSKFEEDYFKPLKKLRMIQQLKNKTSTTQQGSLPTPGVPATPSGIKSFSISDILSNTSSTSQTTSSSTSNPTINVPHPSAPARILTNGSSSMSSTSRFIRPWDTDEEEDVHGEELRSTSSSVSSSSESPRPSSSGPVLVSSPKGGRLPLNQKGGTGTPLDALFKMTSKTFDAIRNASGEDNPCNQLNLFNNKQPNKKKRKSRTAFTNHQIFGLEKRFLYQKYLSPADRDEMAQTLGLSNAQVITWFQNRRAKMKRDVEELKKDVHTASLLGDHTSFIKTMTQMGLLKTKHPLDHSSFMARK